MSFFGTVCAVLVAHLELLIFLHSEALKLPSKPYLSTTLDLELILCTLCMVVTVAPMIHSVSAVVKVNLAWTLFNLVFSYITLYCSSVEFIGAFQKVNMTEKFLPHPVFPVAIAVIVLIARVVQKWKTEAQADLPAPRVPIAPAGPAASPNLDYVESERIQSQL